MKAIVLIASTLCLWLQVQAVVNNGIVSFTPDGALSHTLWRQNPGQASPQYVASFTNSSYAITGLIADGTTFYLRSVFRNDDGSCCKESDFGFVVTPPVTNGTNVLRFTGPTSALVIQSSDGLTGWTNVVTFTGGPPAQLPLLPGAHFFRTTRTNIPPLPPQ